MPRFAANISLLFPERPFIDRVKVAALAGFKGVECQFPYDTESIVMAEALHQAGIPLVLINAPPGNFSAGDRGLAALPDRKIEFRHSIETALEYARATKCPRIHVLAGCIQSDAPHAMGTYTENLAYAAERAATWDITVLIEPVVMPNYFLTRPEQGADIVRRLNLKNLRLQFDVFHAQRAQGNITDFFQRNFEIIGHVQIAGVPGRNEPDEKGEVNWPYIFTLLDALGYNGWVGAEYSPRGDTVEGLKWARPWGISV